MARLQDFHTVTPTDSDNLLIVQTTGQGLAPVGSTIGNKVPRSDLALPSITGTTNNTGSIISVGTYFYLNGVLCRAIDVIGTGATLTLNTNYVTITAGSLNEFAIKTGVLTNMHSAFSGSGLNSLVRTGRVCVLTFFRTISGSIGGATEIATLPSGFIPYADTRLFMGGTYNGTKGLYTVDVTTSGKVVTAVGSGNLTVAMNISGVYICK